MTQHTPKNRRSAGRTRRGAGVSLTPEYLSAQLGNYLFSLSKKKYFGWKCPKNIFVDFENSSADAVVRCGCLGEWRRLLPIDNQRPHAQCFCYSQRTDCVTPRIIHFYYQKILCPGSKHPNSILFTFENKITALAALTDRILGVRSSVFVLAETSVMSPQELFTFSKKICHICGIKVSQKRQMSFVFENKSTDGKLKLRVART